MNRRKYERINVDLPVHYSRNQEARVINLSLCGLNLVTGRLLARGTIVFLIINFPSEELKVVGEVRWSKAGARGKYEQLLTKIRDYFIQMDNFTATAYVLLHLGEIAKKNYYINKIRQKQ